MKSGTLHVSVTARRVYTALLLFGRRKLIMHPSVTACVCACITACARACSTWKIDSTKIDEWSKDSWREWREPEKKIDERSEAKWTDWSTCGQLLLTAYPCATDIYVLVTIQYIFFQYISWYMISLTIIRDYATDNVSTFWKSLVSKETPLSQDTNSCRRQSIVLRGFLIKQQIKSSRNCVINQLPYQYNHTTPYTPWPTDWSVIKPRNTIARRREWWQQYNKSTTIPIHLYQYHISSSTSAVHATFWYPFHHLLL